MEITILVDNPNSWINPFADALQQKLSNLGHSVRPSKSWKDFQSGDIALFLGCEQIVPREGLVLHKHNLVVHASNLPKGKGWSPTTWQILEGKNNLPIVLFEAATAVDSGPIYFKETIELIGHELIDEIREQVGRATIKLALKFIEYYPSVSAWTQVGTETYYNRRLPKDSEVDPHKSLVELFNHFRVADNRRYPIFFKYLGQKYTLSIQKSSE